MNISVFNKTLELIIRLFDSNNSTIPMIPNAQNKPMPGLNAPTDAFEQETPETEGISSSYIEAYLKELEADPTLTMHSVMVLRHGKLLSRCVYGIQDPSIWKMTFSASKSVTSLAIGLLIDRGLLSLSDKVTKFFDKKISALSRITIKDLTVEDLLTMRSTVVFNEATCMTETDWQRGFLNSITVGEIGKDFKYNSLNSYMLASIVNVITKKSLSEFLRETLFKELDIKEFYWETCPQGVEKGGWGLYIHPEDMAKLGQLVLCGGRWNGKQIISEAYIKTATAAHVKTPEENGNYDYGYHIWTSRTCNSFLFNGMFGQNVLGFFDNGVLIVANAGNEELFQSSSFYTITEKYFGKTFDDVLPADEKAFLSLRDSEKSFSPHPDLKKPNKVLSFFKKKESEVPAECAGLSARTFTPDSPHPAFGLLPVALQATQNNYTSGLTSIGFELRSDCRFTLILTEKEAIYAFPVGFGLPEKTTVVCRGEPFRLHTLGRFGKDEDGNLVLTITLAFAETPFTRRMKIRFIKYGEKLKAVLEIKECPSAAYLNRTMNGFIKGMGDIPLLNSVISKTDTDYVAYKIDKVFEPVIELSERKE